MENVWIVLIAAMENVWVWIVLIVAGAITYYTSRTWYLIPLKIKRGVNSDSFTETTFISLVNEAYGVMLVCDDGNKMIGSIYESQKVIDAIQARLESEPTFEMWCMFSAAEDDTCFMNAFREHKHIKIKKIDSRSEVHFKIINGGRKGYVSVHRQGDRERYYTLYTGVFGPARRKIFGSHMDHINQVFKYAA